MKIGEIGEWGLIKRINELISASRKDSLAWQQLVLGVGDDAAAWKCNDVQLITTDSLVQDVHFDMGYTTWPELGYKALAINLSDIAAMGGVPCYALVSLALPPDIEVKDVLELYGGMLKLAEQYGVAVIGGDTDCTGHIAVNVTVTGAAPGGNMLVRSAARPGDKIAVTGYTGSAAAGFRMLISGQKLTPEISQYLRRSFLRPQPRVKEGQLLVANGVKAGIDISDGLVSDLAHICQASNVGARVALKNLAIAREVFEAFGKDAWELALTGGEDYELLFTAPEAVIEKVKKVISCPVTTIGEIISDDIMGVTVMDSQGQPVKIKMGGWQHFISHNGKTD